MLGDHVGLLAIFPPNLQNMAIQSTTIIFMIFFSTFFVRFVHLDSKYCQYCMCQQKIHIGLSECQFGCHIYMTDKHTWPP